MEQITKYIEWKNKRHWYDVRHVLPYKVSYTRGDTKYYSYCNQVSARKLKSEHGKRLMITSIIDTRTGEEIWDK